MRWPAFTGLGAVVALLLSSCGGAAEISTQASEDAQAIAESLGACLEPGEYAPADSLIAETQSWLAVDVARASEALSSEKWPADRSIETSLSVRRVSGGGIEGPDEEFELRLHGSAQSGIAWANDHEGSRIYVGIGGRDLPPNYALFVLVRDNSGNSYFAGECAYDALYMPLTVKFGASLDTVIADAIGQSGEELANTLGVESDEPVAQNPVVLNPQDADPELLKRLTRSTAVVTYPESWSASTTVCTRIEEGWNDCFALDTPSKTGRRLNVYLNQSRRLEFWLMDSDANLVAPLQLIGSITVPAEASGSLGTIYKVNLSGTLDASGRTIVEPVAELG